MHVERIDVLIRYGIATRQRVSADARQLFDVLSRSYVVEFEPPNSNPGCSDWFVQVRLPGEPVCAGYYGVTAREAAASVAQAVGAWPVVSAA